MKYIVALAATFLAAVLATSVIPYIHVLGVSPNPVLILVACWAMVRGQGEAMVVAPLAGLLHDFTATDPVGTSVLALSPIVIMASLRELRPIESEFLPAMAVVATASFTYAVIGMTVLTVTGDDVPWGTGLLRVALPSMIVSPLFATLVYPLVRWLSPRPKPESFGVGSAVQL